MRAYSLAQRRHALIALPDETERILLGQAFERSGIGITILDSGPAVVAHLTHASLGIRGAELPNIMVLGTRLSGRGGARIAMELTGLCGSIPIALVGNENDFDPKDERWKSAVTSVFIRPLEARQIAAYCELAMASRLRPLAERRHS